MELMPNSWLQKNPDLSVNTKQNIGFFSLVKKIRKSTNIFTSEKKVICIPKGTSNWTEDYFEDSAGISIIFEPWTTSDTKNRKNNLLSQLEDIFQRDWNSKLAKNIVYYKL